jgi:hypothetical protein
MLDALPLDLRPVPARPGWFRTAPGNWETQEALVLHLQDRHPLGGWQLVCGQLSDDSHEPAIDVSHSIYAIDGLSPIDLARAFATGSHNLMAPVTDQVCDELARVFAVAPFRPSFVDAAGYKCRFDRPISRAQARQIEEILTEGLEGYLADYSGEGPLLVDALLAENALRLWWD